MKYLVDTNVFSEARRGSQQALRWFHSTNRADIRISVMTIGEIARGLMFVKRKDPSTAMLVEGWLAELRHGYDRQILPISDLVAIEWGRITAIRSRNHADAVIAATAAVHDLVVVTRNQIDFADTGVRIVNPWRLES